MLQKSVDKQKRIGELNMIIATLSDFKLFWDLLDNTDTTEITTEQDSDFMLQLKWKPIVFSFKVFDPDLILSGSVGDGASEESNVNIIVSG